MAPASHLLVGRGEELRALRGALDGAANGRGGVVLLAGEAGIGKTRLAEELAAEAGAGGVAVAWGRCSEDTGAPPLWPWVQVARALARADGDTRRGEGADKEGADAVARLAAADGPDHWDDEGGRFRFFDALARALARLTRRRPCLFVLDDLHWADEASIAFLRFLAPTAADLPMLLLGTYRHTELAAGHPLAGALPELARERASARMTLGGLDVDAARHLVESQLGLPVAAELLDAVHAQTEGNPFFLTETVALLGRDGRLVVAPTAGSRPLAPTVGEVVGRRLDRLSPPARAVLTVLALRGSEAPLPLLRALPSLADVDVLAALDEAEGAGLVTADPGRLGIYRLHHPLVGDVLRSRPGSRRRAALHLEIGDALARLHAANPGPVLAELAHHFLEAAPLGVDERAWRYPAAAGDQAARLYAHEDAVRWYGRALEAADLGAPCEDGERVEVLVGLARAARRAGEAAVAEEALARAAELARRLADHRRLAEVAVAWSELRLAHDPRRIELLDEALAGLGHADRALRAGVLTALVNEWYFADADRARALSEAALDEARASGDRRALIAALATRRLAMWHPDGLDEHERAARELLRLAPAHWPEQVVEGRHGLAVVALERGDLVGFRRQVTAVEQAAERFRLPLQQAWALVMRALLATLSSSLDDADRRAGEAADLCSRAGLEPPLQLALAQRLVTMWERGEPAPAGVEELVTGDGAVEQAWRCGLLMLRSTPGNEAAVAAGLDPVWPHVDASPRDLSWLARHCALAEAVVLTGDRARAAVLAPRLAPYAGRLACFGVGVCLGPVSYHLGRLLALLGDGGALSHLEAAARWADGQGAPRWGARARLALAEVVAADDPARARALAAAARAPTPSVRC